MKSDSPLMIAGKDYTKSAEHRGNCPIGRILAIETSTISIGLFLGEDKPEDSDLNLRKEELNKENSSLKEIW